MIRLVTIGEIRYIESMKLTAERIREVIDYDAITGTFTWRDRPELSGNSRYVGRRAGTKSGRGYRQIQIDGVRYFEHRLVWLYLFGRWPASQIDHKNGNGEQNYFSNLREATATQNHCNSRRMKKNTSGIKGVSFDARRKKWRASIAVNSRQFSLGYYSTKIEAGEAYAEAAVRVHGQFARLA